MMRRTHLALIILLLLIFTPHVSHKITFMIFAFIAAIVPDIDSYYSAIGRFWFLRPVQFFTRHRGALHSFSLCILISVLLALFLPVLAFPVFLGYSTHVLFDSFTIEGIQPFWPLKNRVSGWVSTNSRTEHGILLCLLFMKFIIITTRTLRFLSSYIY